LGIPEAEIDHYCFLQGQLSFLRDPWKAADKVLEKARHDTSPPEVDPEQTPVPIPPPPSSLLTSFLDSVENSVGEEGIRSMPFLHRSPNGRVVFAALVLDNGNQVFKVVVETLRSEHPTEFVFGIDRYVTPDLRSKQGIEFKDFVTVIWYHESQFYVGIINYRPASAPEGVLVRPIDWNNRYWNALLRTHAGEVPILQKALGESVTVTPTTPIEA
jgi:hypothetical protein